MHEHMCTHAADKGFLFYEQRTSLCLVLPTHFNENLEFNNMRFIFRKQLPTKLKRQQWDIFMFF